MLTRSAFTILVLDRAKVDAANLEIALNSAGYSVAGPVSTAEQALPLFETTTVHAAFLDVTNGDESGALTIARLLQMRQIPFFFTTATDRTYPRHNGFKQITLLKPLDRATIEKLLNLVTSSASYGA